MLKRHYYQLFCNKQRADVTSKSCIRFIRNRRLTFQFVATPGTKPFDLPASLGYVDFYHGIPRPVD